MQSIEVRARRSFSDRRGPRDKTARHNWWPVAYASEVRADPTKPRSVTLFGEPLVLFAAEDGSLQCVADLCAHNSAALSQGYVERGELVCRYHGWRYGAGGRCTSPPDLAGKKSTTRYAYPVVDDGLIVWVYPSRDEPVEFVNPLVEYTGRAGVHVRGYRPRVFEFDQAWELWAASFLDRTHHEHAHPNTIIRTQRETVRGFFDEKVTPAATAVHAKHDRVLGLFLYLLFSPVDEHRHKQFLTLLPTSDLLPARAAYGLFRALRVPQVVAYIAYEDYYLIAKQAERIGQGAAKWGIRGKYGSPLSEQLIDWHLAREKDAVWFEGYSPDGTPLLRPSSPPRRRPGPVVSPLVEDSGYEIGPYSNGDRRLREPDTWRRLNPYDQAVKSLATRILR
jgi:nitrite reductase/ring-hydroxylating ferredoxin subunit